MEVKKCSQTSHISYPCKFHLPKVQIQADKRSFCFVFCCFDFRKFFASKESNVEFYRWSGKQKQDENHYFQIPWKLQQVEQDFAQDNFG